MVLAVSLVMNFTAFVRDTLQVYVCVVALVLGVTACAICLPSVVRRLVAVMVGASAALRSPRVLAAAPLWWAWSLQADVSITVRHSFRSAVWKVYTGVWGHRWRHRVTSLLKVGSEPDRAVEHTGAQDRARTGEQNKVLEEEGSIEKMAPSPNEGKAKRVKDSDDKEKMKVLAPKTSAHTCVREMK